jgi:hypothetical protein
VVLVYQLRTRVKLMALRASNRVLGGSASGRRTPERQKGDVVLLFPALTQEGVELLQEEVTYRPLLSVLGDERPRRTKKG